MIKVCFVGGDSGRRNVSSAALAAPSAQDDGLSDLISIVGVEVYPGMSARGARGPS
jgi:hypothetical protein